MKLINLILIIIALGLGFVYIQHEYYSEYINNSDGDTPLSQAELPHSHNNHGHVIDKVNMLNALVIMQSDEPSESEFGKPLNLNHPKARFYANYLDKQIEANRIYRWSKSHLTYYITPEVRRNMQPYVIKQVFKHWHIQSKLFSFQEVSSADNADIHIDMGIIGNKTHMAEAGPDRISNGMVYTMNDQTYSEYIIKHASINISNEFFSKEQLKKYKRKRNTTPFHTLTHEVGHVLGLIEHSDIPATCMYFQADSYGKGCNSLTLDVNTLAMLYGRTDPLRRHSL